MIVSEEGVRLANYLKFPRNLFNHSSSLQPSVTAMNSASVVESATHFWSLDCHVIAPPAKVMMKPDVDFQLSGSPARSESV